MELALSSSLSRLNGAIGLQKAIFSTGDSIAVLNGSTFGTTLAARLDGRFAKYTKAGTGYPGQSATTVRTSLAAESLSRRKAIVIIEGGRNGIATNLAQVKTDIQGIVSDLAAIGNTRYVILEIPLTLAEKTAGAGNAGYDNVLAYNAWLAATFTAARVVPAQDISWTYDSGDGVHPNNTGYDVLCTAISDKLAALCVADPTNWLDTSLPAARQANSANLDTIGKYIWATAPIASLDRLPKNPESQEQTYSVWYKGSGQGVLIGRYDGAVAASRVALRYSAGSIFGFFGNGVFTSAAATFADGNWHHACLTIRNVAGTYKGDLYVDGVAKGTQQNSAALTTTHEFRVGESASGTTSFACLGKYYQPMIWNVGLSPAQVTTLYNAGVPLAAASSPAASSIVWCPDFDRISNFNVIRGVPDRAGSLDARTSGMSSADITTDIP